MINEITPQDLMARITNEDEVLIVDMRQPWEYQAGHIPSAENFFIQDIPGRLNEFPKDKDIVFQCWHGNTSLQASAFLIENGWDGDPDCQLERWHSRLGRNARSGGVGQDVRDQIVNNK